MSHKIWAWRRLKSLARIVLQACRVVSVWLLLSLFRSIHAIQKILHTYMFAFGTSFQIKIVYLYIERITWKYCFHVSYIGYYFGFCAAILDGVYSISCFCPFVVCVCVCGSLHLFGAFPFVSEALQELAAANKCSRFDAVVGFIEVVSDKEGKEGEDLGVLAHEFFVHKHRVPKAAMRLQRLTCYWTASVGGSQVGFKHPRSQVAASQSLALSLVWLGQRSKGSFRKGLFAGGPFSPDSRVTLLATI